MAAICSLTLLVSAFLLFSIQPMVAKMLLPILGGSPSVWNTAMVFYQGALLLGYLYSHLIAKKLDLRKQLFFHLALLVVPFVVLPLYFNSGLRPPTDRSPIPWMMVTMALSVGLPFFVLSASSPLVQTWFARSGGKNPYSLYAASNVGSFLGLLSYPFLIEPNLTTVQQSQFWTAGYVLLFVLFLMTMFETRKSQAALPEAVEVEEPAVPIDWKRKLRWIFLAFIPSSHFIGVTTFLTTDIAVMPLLWVIPLAIYLLTMILVFANKPPIPHNWIVTIAPFALAGLMFVSIMGLKMRMPNIVIFPVHLLMLFLGAMLCHGELAKDKPNPKQLTEFFLLMSFGGVLGGVFNALIAPVIFVQVVEYSLIIVLLGLALPARVPGWRQSLVILDLAIPFALFGVMVGLVYAQRNWSMVSDATAIPWLMAVGCLAVIVCAARPLRFALALAAMTMVGVYNGQTVRKTIFLGRSFFGVHRVESIGKTHNFMNGRILHGKQSFDNTELIPSTYYHFAGPLRPVMATRKPGARVGVVGLGVGSMALWSRKSEDWTYFEIDPLVEKMALDPTLFTCLTKAQVRPKIVMGDARLSLEQPQAEYDLLLIDAFSSDSVPAHLLTVEAFQLYQKRLKPGGLLAVHISNKYLDLEPVIAAVAEAVNYRAFVCDEMRYKMEIEPGRSKSSWAVCGPKGIDWSSFEDDPHWPAPQKRPGVKAWTDDYSSLQPIMRSVMKAH
ncbi:MAG: fused MFS/spermidine synthase [Fimbriimonadaceae bacterium]